MVAPITGINLTPLDENRASLQMGDIRVQRSVFGSALVTGDGNTVTVLNVIYAADVQRQPPIKDAAGINPYRGLDTFDETGAHLFFGRERVVAALIARLDRMTGPVVAGDRKRILAVMGPSGCGKSSVVLAGLLPALARSASPSLRDATVIVLRPRHAPLESLADALGRTPAGQALPDTARRQLAPRFRQAARSGSPDSTLQILQQVMPPSGALIIVVDQFEETYTLCRSDNPSSVAQRDAMKAERDFFVSTLLVAAGEAGGRISVLLTLRSDFYGALTEHPALSAVVSEGHILVPAMEGDELRRAITEPARIAGHALSPHTVDRLLDEADSTSGTSLPLLSFALFQIWNGLREGIDPDTTLTRFGGVGGALAFRADTVLVTLAGPARALARDAFLGTIQLGEGGRDTRRRVLLDDAVAAGAAPDARAALEPFVAARLLVVDAAADGQVWIELPHEALIRHWHKLQTWIDAERDDLRLLLRAREAARAWRDPTGTRGGLWRPPDLVLLQKLSERRELPALSAEFLTASVRGYRFARRVTWGFAVLFLLVAVGGGFAMYSKWRSDLTADQLRRSNIELGAARAASDLAADRLRRSNAQLAAARAALAATEIATFSRQATQRGDAMTGMLLALEAAEIPDAHGISAARAALLDAWLSNREVATVRAGYNSALNHAAFVGDASHIRLVSYFGTTEWDLTPGHPPVSHSAADVSLQSASAFFAQASSPDGSRNAVTPGDGLTHVFGPAGHIMTIAAKYGGRSERLNFSGDGRHLATASADGTLAIWRVDAPLTEPEFEIHLPDVTGVALSQDGQILAAGSKDGTLRLWYWGRQEAAPTPLHCEPGLSRLLFDQNGDKLFTICGNGAADVWDLSTKTPVARRLVGHSQPVNGGSFSVDGTRIVTVSYDRTARVWDLADPSRPVMVLRGYTDVLSAAHFNPNGNKVVTASSEGIVRVWDISGPSPKGPVILAGHVGAITDASFSPDGSRVLAIGRDGTARVWDVSAERPLATMFPAGGAAALSPDGSIVAAARRDGSVALHDLSHPDQPPVDIPGHGRPLLLVSYSPNGQTLMTADGDGALAFWNVTIASPRLLGMVKMSAPGWIKGATFSPDGDRVLTTWVDARARIWSLSDLSREPLVLEGRYGTFFGGWSLEASFSPDGTHVLTTWPERASWLWDISGPRPSHDVLDESPSAFRGAFSPDGGRIVLGYYDGTTEIWQRAKDQISLTRRLPGGHRAIGKVTFTADGRRVVTQALGGEIRIWDLSAEDQKPTVLDSTDEGIQDFDLSPDGLRLVVASASGSARLWDFNELSPAVSELIPPADDFLRVEHASFSRDGRRVMIIASDGVVRIFNTPPITELEDSARRALTRCLTIAQREAASLPVSVQATADRNTVSAPPCNQSSQTP